MHRDIHTGDPIAGAPPRLSERVASTGSPVVVMLGLFSVSQCWVSAVTVEGTRVVWLDLITRTGNRSTPLGVVSDTDSSEPRLTLETFHRSWAERPEIRWHLLRQSVLMYRAYFDDRIKPPTLPGPPTSSPPSAVDRNS